MIRGPAKISPIDLGELRLARALGLVAKDHLGRLEAFQRDGVESEESPEDTDRMVRTMTELLRRSLPGPRGGRWELGEMDLIGIGGSFYLKESRTQARAHFMIRLGTFTLSLSLDRAEYLGRARDAFWLNLASLTRTGELTFEPSAIPEPLWDAKAAVGGRPNHAVVDLMRFWNLHLTERDPFMDFGSLEVAWSLDIPAEPLSRSIKETLEVFYRLSYELHRLERQGKRGRARK
ncbi:MAG TPA: hypothetical protein VK188_18105 [Holophaga sp.]|nr:hypothetical protein [Holophaga sp.]